MNRSPQWEEARKTAFKRDGGQCQDCGQGAGPFSILHVHHITPRSEGGSHELSNLTTLCPDCHAERHGVEACNTCGSVLHDGYYDKQVFDGDGAALVSVCSDCWEVLESEASESGCATCGREIEGRSEYAVADMEMKSYHDLCEKCRKHLVFQRQLNGRGYFAAVSSVRFQQWRYDDE